MASDRSSGSRTTFSVGPERSDKAKARPSSVVRDRVRLELKLRVHAQRVPEPVHAEEGPHGDDTALAAPVIALVGVICGANGWGDIRDVAEDRRAWFARFLDIPKGVPSADTFRRLLSALRPNAFMECISSWVHSLAEPLDGQVVAFDGKIICGAVKRSPFGMLHQVHVWACAQRLLLAQTHVTGAPEEPDAVRRLLELIELKGAIVTGDAAHCSKASAQAFVDARGAYLLQLKGNRAALHARVVEHFERAELTQKNATHAKTAEEAPASHQSRGQRG